MKANISELTSSTLKAQQPDVDALAQFIHGVIREFDGKYQLGADTLAERIVEQFVLTPRSICPTCDGNGVIGGPSYCAPDEGWVPCPDCATPQSEQVVSNPIGVEAIGEVVDGPDGKKINWLIEGGLSDIPEGMLLIIADQQITDADGSGEVFLTST